MPTKLKKPVKRTTKSKTKKVTSSTSTTKNPLKKAKLSLSKRSKRFKVVSFVLAVAIFGVVAQRISTAAPVTMINEDFNTSAAGMDAISGGSWFIYKNVYVVTNPAKPASSNTGNGNISLHKTPVIGDFELVTAGAVVNDADEFDDFSVIFNYQDINNYYYVSFNEKSDPYTNGLFKIVNGTQTRLVQFPSSALIADTPRTSVKITRTGSNIQVQRARTGWYGVTGPYSVIATATDSSFQNGRVGVGSRNDSANFDYLRVVSESQTGDTQAPTVPAGLVSTAKTDTTVALRWNASTDNTAVTGYRVFRNGGTTAVGTVAGTTFTDVGLTPSTAYTYRVRAYDARGNLSALSASISVTTNERVTEVPVGTPCTPGTMGIHGPCANPSSIPAPRTGVSTSQLQAAGGDGGGEPGAFRHRCDFSHMNYDDPILYPGQQNKAHLHTFFGNTRANYQTTSASLMSSGNSTCSGGTFNRSAYWVPTMVDTATYNVVTPLDDRSALYHSDLEIYYKQGYQGLEANEVTPFPNGLQMIAGNSATATSAPQKGRNQDMDWAHFYCEDGQNPFNKASGLPPSDHIGSFNRTAASGGGYTTDPLNNAHCPRNDILVMKIEFPQCWNGRDLTSANGRDHLRYGTYGQGCPAGFPVGLPFVEMFIRWKVTTASTSTWRLTSDHYTNGPGGYSGHADYMFAWDTSAFESVRVNCYLAQRDCGYHLGNGREPRHIREIQPRF